jgi:hypothetical protein
VLSPPGSRTWLARQREMASPAVGEIERVGAASRLLSRSLSGYLCGTHSGWLDRRRGDRLSVEALCVRHGASEAAVAVETLTWEARWRPDDAAAGMAGRLATALEHPSIVDLLVYGSHANGNTTGFSDLDAVLVIGDEVAQDAAALREIRPRVLAAQRAVQAYQPMQHHGFEVATPRLLATADAALQLPSAALQGATSLFGRRIDAGFAGHGLDPADRLRSMVADLSALSAWPGHPWRLHGAVSMFELLPALYLQALGVPVAKANSFAVASEQFQADWRPFDVLKKVREVWPRGRNQALEIGSRAARNPWVPVAAWTRLPYSWPAPVSPLLTAGCLKDLQDLASQMTEATR